MLVWIALVACDGAPDAELRSAPIAPTRDLSTPAIAVPADSPLAQFVPVGAPGWPKGMLGKLAPGLPLGDVRRIAAEIRDPHRPPDDLEPAPGFVAVSGQLLGYERIGFVAVTERERLISLDVSAEPLRWEGVLETAWGAGKTGALANGLPTATWEAPGLTVTQIRGQGGLIVVQWKVSGEQAPQPR